MIGTAMTRIALLLLCQFALQICMAQDTTPQPVEGDVVVKNFRFVSNEVLPELRLHYRTVGKLERDAKGVARNAVLIMHGTGGSGAQFLRADFAGTTVSCRRRARRDKIFHRPSRWHRPRQIQQAQRWPAGQVSTLWLSRHGGGSASTAAGTGCRSSAAGDGHLDGRHADVAVGRASTRSSWTRSCRLPACRRKSPAAIASGDAWSSMPSATIHSGNRGTTKTSRNRCGPRSRCCS